MGVNFLSSEGWDKRHNGAGGRVVGWRHCLKQEQGCCHFPPTNGIQCSRQRLFENVVCKMAWKKKIADLFS